MSTTQQQESPIASEELPTVSESLEHSALFVQELPARSSARVSGIRFWAHVVLLLLVSIPVLLVWFLVCLVALVALYRPLKSRRRVE